VKKNTQKRREGHAALREGKSGKVNRTTRKEIIWPLPENVLNSLTRDLKAGNAVRVNFGGGSN